jgi:hypothetical protein
VTLDAIDELPENDIYPPFDILQQLSDLAGARLQFFCTSRPRLLISEEVERLRWRTMNLRVEETDKDISKYVRNSISSKSIFPTRSRAQRESIFKSPSKNAGNVSKLFSHCADE